MKLNFRTVYDEHKRVTANVGSRYAPTYHARYDDNGVKDLVQDDMVDVYEHIQSFRDSVDINVILQRMEMTGDTSLLQRRASAFMDVSEMPTNYAAYLNMVSDAEAFFAALPQDVREQFGQDPVRFINSIGTEQFKSVVDRNLPKEEEKVVINGDEKQ